MWVIQAIGLFLCAAAWRVTGLQSLGRIAVRSMASKNENIRAIAGILVSKAGERAEPLLQELLQRRENVPMVLTVLAGFGDPKLEKDILPFSTDHDPQIAEAARQALRVIAAGR
jgi:hypothetical protein